MNRMFEFLQTMTQAHPVATLVALSGIALVLFSLAVCFLAKAKRIWGVAREEQKERRLLAVSRLERERADREDRERRMEQETREREDRYWESESAYTQYGLHAPDLDFATSALCKDRLDTIREKQKKMIKDKKACQTPHSWTINGSEAKGRKFINDFSRLMIRSFNNEVAVLVGKTRYDNKNRIEERIFQSFKAINRGAVSFDCALTDDYRILKVKEMYLAFEYQDKLHAEREAVKEANRLEKERLRDDKELAKTLKQAEKDETKFEEMLEKARMEMAAKTGKQKETMERKIRELTEKLREAETRKKRAVSMAQLTRAGYVYVISNLGAFGEDVFKIGMSRRVEPLDRVHELGNASVPFHFDVHAMIYSEDAPSLENRLHQAFKDNRVNLMNNRKEFFRTSLEAIEKEVVKMVGPTDFKKGMEARQYRESEAMRGTPVKQADDGKKEPAGRRPVLNLATGQFE